MSDHDIDAKVPFCYFRWLKTGVTKLIAKSHRWQLAALTLASLLSLSGTHALALSLGRLTVQSALGEPLKAEIDIPDLNAEEAASLKTQVALPETFKAAGLEYNPAMSGLQVTLTRRPDGRAYLRLSSDRAVNDPFVDMILEASWNSGRIVRDYTMLFDPPSLRATSNASPTLGQVPAPNTRAPLPLREPTVKVVPGPAAKPMPSTPPDKKAAQQVTVKTGDTAGKIAANNKPANVSLDQMLVALMRANPDAFIRDNVNRIKAGALVTLPSEEQASAINAAQASQIIIAQSQDFNDFRRKLATNVPTAPVAAVGRNISGKVEATVEDKKPLTPTPDKLTLSKGAVQGKSNEDQLAQARSAKEAASRAAEISKNISDLNKLVSASAPSATPPNVNPASAAQAAPPTLTAVVPIAPISTPASAQASASAANAPASAAPVTVASAPKKPASTAIKPPAPPVLAPAEPSFIDDLVENPLLPAAAGGLILMLAGLGFYKARQRKKAASLDSSFLENRLNPESFFGNSGGQKIDTSESMATGSSMVYSPSQIDAVDDVDPVAEADVYLAYGRDLQAEEILKDALRSQPERLAIHQKLLEIYAKRRDAKAFEAMATLAFNLTNGTGSEWEKICESGHLLDPNNSLYLPGGHPVVNSEATVAFVAAKPASPDVDQDSADQDGAPNSVSLDLDLDFSLDDPVTEPFVEVPQNEPLPTFGLDFEPEATQALETSAKNPVLPELPQISETSSDEADQPEDDLRLDQPLDLPSSSTQPVEEPKPVVDSGMLEFDLGSLSLDLGDPAPETESGAMPNTEEDPLATKLALAEEFQAIGDDDGARALIEEVIAEAAGDMKSKAQRALSRL